MREVWQQRIRLSPCPSRGTHNTTLACLRMRIPKTLSQHPCQYLEEQSFMCSQTQTCTCAYGAVVPMNAQIDVSAHPHTPHTLHLLRYGCTHECSQRVTAHPYTPLKLQQGSTLWEVSQALARVDAQPASHPRHLAGTGSSSFLGEQEHEGVGHQGGEEGDQTVRPLLGMVHERCCHCCSAAQRQRLGRSTAAAAGRRCSRRGAAAAAGLCCGGRLWSHCYGSSGSRGCVEGRCCCCCGRCPSALAQAHA